MITSFGDAVIEPCNEILSLPSDWVFGRWRDWQGECRHSALLWSCEFLKSKLLINTHTHTHTHTYVLHDSASGKLAHKNKSTGMHDFVYKIVMASSLWWKKEVSGNKMNAGQLGDNCKHRGTPLSWICIYERFERYVEGKASAWLMCRSCQNSCWRV